VAAESKPSKGLYRNVYVLGLTSLLTDVSSELAVTILPFYLVDALKASLLEVGLIDGLAELVSSVTKVFSGFVGDVRGGRKAIATLGYSISAVVRPLFGFAPTPADVAALRALDRVGKGVRNPPRDAMIAESVLPEKLGRAFGLHRSMDTAGAVIGITLAILILYYSSTVNYTFVFLAGSVPGFISVMVLAALAVETRREGSSKKEAARSVAGRQLAVYLGFSALLSLSVVGSVDTSRSFMLLRANQVLGAVAGNAHLAIIASIGLYFAANLVYAGASPFVGRIGDRMGVVKSMVAAPLLVVLASVVMALASDVITTALGFALYGLALSASETLGKAAVPKVMKSRGLGSGYGIVQTVQGLAAFVGAAVFGGIFQTWSYALAFEYSAVMAGAAFVSAYALYRLSSR
jgi:MFS family permease